MTLTKAVTLAAAIVSVWAIGAVVVLGRLPSPALPFVTAVLCAAWAGGLLYRRGSPGLRAASAAAVLALLVGTATAQAPAGTDPEPASEQPWTLLRHGTLLLDEAPILREKPRAHWIYRRPDGKTASWYPPGMALLLTPFYLPTALAAQPSSALLAQFARMASALLSALAILLLGLALARAGSPPGWIFAACLLYGLCSSALSLLAQLPWQQSGIALATSLSLFAAASPRARGSSSSGFAAGIIAAAVRPPDVLLVAPFVWAARSWRLAVLTACGVGAGAGAFLASNWLTFGSPLSMGYRLGQGHLGFTTGELPESIVGLLLSPAHGLIVFVPWVVLAPLAWRTGERLARAALLSALLLFALISCWWCWWGGDAFGPRMLAESQLPLAFAVGRVGPSLTAIHRRALVVLGLVGFLTHGAYLFWLSADPRYSPAGAWENAAHPIGYVLRAEERR